MSYNIYHLSPKEFVEKYKLIPKQLRLKFINFLEEHSDIIERNVPDQWLSSNRIEYDEQYSNILNDLFYTLKEYEEMDGDNYLVLYAMLHEDVFGGRLSVFTNVSNALLRYLKWQEKKVSLKDVCLFRNKQVMRQILDVVAYLPGNPGYEKAKAHFESLVFL